MEWIQPFILGFMGSFHCIGMCGPLVIALPLQNDSPRTRMTGIMLYHTGRIITYGMMGLTFGLLGFGLYIWGIQQWVSLAMGLAMIISVAFPLLLNGNQPSGWSERLFLPVKRQFGRFLKSRGFFSVWMIGLLNGLLPCGLVYIALAGALMTNSPVNGALSMLIFGAGTIPALTGLALLGNAFGTVIRKKFRGIIPYLVLFIGVLFVLRGMNLGIPYLSPKMSSQAAQKTEQFQKPECCSEKP